MPTQEYMDSQYPSVLNISNIYNQTIRANIYIQPCYFLLSIVTNSLNIRILRCRSLRSSLCAYYLSAYTGFSLIYTFIMCPTQFLNGFSINWTDSYIGCKVYFYVLFLIPFQANLMLILASFDRYYTSLNASRITSKTKIRKTQMIIILSTIFSIIYMLPRLAIYQWNKNNKKCLANLNKLLLTYVFTHISIYYILTPTLMLILGLMTIRNIREQSRRTNRLRTSISCRRSQAQLTQMLLVQVVAHLILILPFGIAYTMNLLPPSPVNAVLQVLRPAFLIWRQLDYNVSFFLYISSGSIYRKEFLRILSSIKSRRSSPEHDTLNRNVKNGKMLLIGYTKDNVQPMANSLRR